MPEMLCTRLGSAFVVMNESLGAVKPVCVLGVSCDSVAMVGHECQHDGAVIS